MGIVACTYCESPAPGGCAFFCAAAAADLAGNGRRACPLGVDPRRPDDRAAGVARPGPRGRGSLRPDLRRGSGPRGSSRWRSDRLVEQARRRLDRDPDIPRMAGVCALVLGLVRDRADPDFRERLARLERFAEQLREANRDWSGGPSPSRRKALGLRPWAPPRRPACRRRTPARASSRPRNAGRSWPRRLTPS